MSRVPSFPTPLINEAFQSVISRHLARCAGSAANNLKNLGLTGASSLNLISNCIHNLTKRLPESHPWSDDPSKIVMQHSIVPLLLTFSRPPVFELLISTLSLGKSSNPISTLGLTHSSSRRLLIDKEHKFCPRCLEEDLQTHGFPAFYRHHQPKFVKMCPTHSMTLVTFCRNCSQDLASTKTWRLPNSCTCQPPNFANALPNDLSDKTLQALLRLARRTLCIINEIDTASTLAAELDSKLLAAGLFTPTGNLKRVELRKLIDSVYDPSFLLALNLNTDNISWSNSAVSPRRPRRRTPNFLQSLLLLDALDGLHLPSQSAPPPKSLELIDKGTLTKAIQDVGQSIDRISAALNIGHSQLISMLRHYKIRLELSPRFINRLGSEKLDDIRAAIINGSSFDEIQYNYGLSSWSLSLIRLDNPDLDSLHKKNSKLRKLHDFKAKVTAFLELNPGALRSEVRTELPHVVDWLYTEDRGWLDNINPVTTETGRYPRPRHRVDIEQIEEKFCREIKISAQRILQRSGRPKRLTKTMLMKSVGLTSILGPKPKSPRCPRAFAEAERLAESLEEFEIRLIRWSMHEYAKLHVPISSNRLRRIARLPVSHIYSNRYLIIELAAELELSFDSRCTLSSSYSSCSGEPLQLNGIAPSYAHSSK